MKNFGVRYEDGSWLRADGYATPVGSVARAWSGSLEDALRMIELEIPLGPAEAAPLPVAAEGA